MASPSPSPKRQRILLPADIDLLCDERLTPILEDDVPSDDDDGDDDSTSGDLPAITKDADTQVFPPESYLTPELLPRRIPPVEAYAAIENLAGAGAWTPDSLEPEGAYALLLQLRGCFVTSPLPAADDEDTELRCSEGCSQRVIQDRSPMVRWMSTYRLQARGEDRIDTFDLELQEETISLAVSIFDRFLTAGCFRVDGDQLKRYVRIAGVACLMTARKLEETYPYTDVADPRFGVLGEMYERPEVVAMEWLVQEVLRFRCYPYEFFETSEEQQLLNDSLSG